MRDLHEQMLAAVIDGDGLEGVAELASGEVGGPVAILLPALGLAAGWPDGAASDPELVGWAAATAGDRNGELPGAVEATVPILLAGDEVGRVVALSRDRDPDAARLIDREEVLRWASLATLTEIAVVEARDRLAEELRGSFIEDLRRGELSGSDVLRRARRLDCDLEPGTVAIASLARGGKPRYMAAIISSAGEPAITEPLGERVLALLGSGDATASPEAVTARAREVVARLRPHGPAAASSFYSDPADAGRALEEAELLLDVVDRDPRLATRLEDGIPGGVYRLLIRALASDPAEVVRFYEDTVAVLVDHDREHRTDLLGTLEAYLEADCSVRATAAAVYAHRHTVSHRLGRIRELCGLDPSSGADRERLGLGIKAYRLIEPTLPR